MVGFTVLCLIPFTLAGYQFVEITKNSPNMPKGYVFPDISDMKMTAIASVFFALIEIVFRKIFYVIFVPYCKE